MLPHELAGIRIHCTDGGVERELRARQRLARWEERHALLERGDEGEPDIRVIARRPPVGAAARAGEYHLALITVLARRQDRMAAGIEPARPVLPYEGHAAHEGPGRAIDHVIEPVAVGPDEPWLVLPFDGAVRDHRHLHGIPVVSVAGCRLEIPQ